MPNDPSRRHRASGRRKAGGIRATCGYANPIRADHYLTKEECRALDPKRKRAPKKPQFGSGSLKRHAIYAQADPQWAEPRFLIPSGFHPNSAMTDTHSIQLVQVRTQLFRHEELAREMKVGTTFVLAMKRAGYRFTHTHQTTIESALAWRAAFPDFRSRKYLLPNWKKLPKLLLNDARASSGKPEQTSASLQKP